MKPTAELGRLRSRLILHEPSIGEEGSVWTLLAVFLASLLTVGCTERSTFPSCREKGVSLRKNTAPAKATKGDDQTLIDDAVTLAVMPGWQLEIAKYGEVLAEEAKPLFIALDETLVRDLGPGDRLHAFFLAVGKILTLDPNLAEEGMDISRPLVVKILPKGTEPASLQVQMLSFRAEELPPPDLYARIGIPSTNPVGLLHHLQRELAVQSTCLPAGAGPSEAMEVCKLKEGGFIVLEALEGVVRIDLISGDSHDKPERVNSTYRDFVQKAPVVDGTTIQSEGIALLRDNAVLAATVPGRMVRPIAATMNRAFSWDHFIAGPTLGWAYQNHIFVGAFGGDVMGRLLLSLPWRRELESTRLTLSLADSVRVSLEARLTDQGARLIDLGLQPLTAGKKNTDFDFERILSSVEPVRLWSYHYSDPNMEFLPEGSILPVLFLQSPMLALKSIARDLHPEHRDLHSLGGIIAKGLKLGSVSWRTTSQGRGTLATISGKVASAEGQRAITLLNLRAWIASSHLLRVEACLLPDRLPCKQSSCGDDLIVEDLVPSREVPSNPCWEKTLSGVQKMFADLAGLERLTPDWDGPGWPAYLADLRANLACVAKDPNLASEAKAIDQALSRFVAQKGQRIETAAKPVLFHSPPAPRAKR